MPVIDESRAFWSTDLHDDADNYGTHDTGDFGTSLADQELLDDISNEFSRRPDAMRIVYSSNDHHHSDVIFS